MFETIKNKFRKKQTDMPVIVQSINDSKDVNKVNIPVSAKTINIYENMKSKQYTDYDLYSGWIRFPDREFNVIEKALDVEPYLKRSINRFIEIIWKQEYTFIGDNKECVDYIKRRFNEIAYISKTPTIVLFENISTELLSYANVFIKKVRNAKASSGQRVKYNDKILTPIAMYDILKTENVIIKAKTHYDILEYRYSPPEFRTKIPNNRYNSIYNCLDVETYEPQDIIHMTLNKPAGDFYGKPDIIGVLNDARSLRRMEENVELLVFQHMIPLIHVKIGSDNKLCQQSEIDGATSKFPTMLAEGMIITDHRHKIEAISTQSATIDAKPYLDYFKIRLLSGMGQSIVSIGESGESSRATADILMESVYDMADRLKKIIVEYINLFIINELLAEGGYNPFIKSNVVKIFIPDSNFTIKSKKEANAILLYNSNLITDDEAREYIGRQPLTKKERKKLKSQLEQETEEDTTTTNSTVNSANNISNPSNQYGQQKGRTKRTSDELVEWYYKNIDVEDNNLLDNFIKYLDEKKYNYKDKLSEIEMFFKEYLEDKLIIKTTHDVYNFNMLKLYTFKDLVSTINKEEEIVKND